MSINRQVTAPLAVPRTNRNNPVTVLTSFKAGYMVPVKAVPLFREDAAKGRMNIAIEMQETAEILMNPVNAEIEAWFVPTLAFERFEGSMDQFNRSFKGQKKTDDASATVTPFVETHAYGTHGSNAVYAVMGIHGKPTDQVNTAYIEAMNLVWNYKAENRSPKITKRTRLDATLPPGFWHHSRFDNVVPKFDSATMEGEVALNVVADKLRVRGIGFATDKTSALGPFTVKETQDQTTNYPRYVRTNESGIILNAIPGSPSSTPDVWAEMTENGITVSLANIDLARKTQAFAKLREQYAGHDDEYIIDMLMDGLTIPDQALKQPMLVARTMTQFRMAERFQTSGDLTEKAVSGAAMASISVRVPKVHTGGIIMVFVTVAPDQLFERQRDPYFHSTNADVISETGCWPQYLRDTLDPEKVVAVPNGYIDTDHANPNGTFGYAELNFEWNMPTTNVGGKFLRPTANTGFDEDRQRLWAVETVNPQLGETFYIMTPGVVHHKPFLDTVSDAFEITALGNFVINGNTVFGPPLIEASNNYEKVMDKAPMDRIEQEG